MGTVCKFYQNGNCRFGNNCRFEHPGANTAGNSNRNRFSSLSGDADRLGGGNMPDYTINTTENINDLTAGKGRPQWLLSSWGPREAPKGFFEDYSPEEVRWRFYELASQGKEAEADQEAIAMWNKADNDMKQLARSAGDIGNIMREAEKQHPNRWDFLKVDGTKTREQIIQEAEARNSNSANPGFGAASNSNATSNPFSKPPTATFGQATQPSAFGAPAASSPFGKPAFGSTGFGNNTSSSPFAQGSGASAFGKPAFGGAGSGNSAFGQPSQPTSTFGQPSQSSSPFGQPSQPNSTFGQPSQPSSGFGQPSQPGSAFGQPSQPSSGFGASGFGAAGPKNLFAPASASSGFGQAGTAFGQPSQPTSAFGQPSQPTSAFGQPSQPTSAFGAPSQPTSAFGQPSQPTSAFGQPSQPATTIGQSNQPISTFGQPSQATSTFGQATPFGQTSQPTSGFGQPNPPTSNFGQSPSAFGQPNQPTGTFGQLSQPNATFGSSAQASSGFGSSNTAFGQPSASTNPFNARSAGQQPNDQSMEASSPGRVEPAPQDNPRAAPEATKSIMNSSSTPHPLTGNPPAAVIITQSLPFQPPRKNGSGQLQTYRGQRVEYINEEPCYRRPDGKGYQKIWFPDGGATLSVVALNREDKLDDLQGAEEEYTDQVREEYKHFIDTGSFMGGKIPLVPPLREWTVYDF